MAADDFGLGTVVRAWRDRLAPEAVGLSRLPGSRAPGLRREDLSQIAGISVDYIVRIEQGRSKHPSRQIVAALARALQLSFDERDHLYRLAGYGPPTRQIDPHVPPGLQQMLTRLGRTPAAVFAADWTMVWWNPAWSALFGDPGRLTENQRNLVRRCFPRGGDGESVTLMVSSVDDEVRDRALVADLRQAAGHRPDDARLTELISSRIEGNPRFARLWNDAEVGRHMEDRKTIHHPAIGLITVDCNVLIEGGGDLRVVVYTARPGSEDASKLDLAVVASPNADVPLLG